MTYSIVFLFFILLFIVGTSQRNHGLIDIGWGLSFCVLTLALYLQTGPSLSPSLVLVATVLLWGLRLSLHLARRNIGKPEDFRYKAMREKWGNRYPGLQAFIKVYMLQMGFMLIVSLPIQMAFFNQKSPNMLILIVGILVFTLGYSFEVLGDLQLTNFKKDPQNKGKLITSGVWALTRHPNYFGEAVLWWGIYILALSLGAPWWTLIGPLTIHLLLRYVSGVPLLEDKYKGRADFEAYKRTTPIFIPKPFGKV